MSTSAGSLARSPDEDEDFPVRQVSLHVDRIKDPKICPECGSTHIFWEGVFRREFVEELRDGCSQGEDVEDLHKAILAIHCRACRTRFSLETEGVFQLRSQIMQLQLKAAAAEGKNLVVAQKERVQ